MSDGGKGSKPRPISEREQFERNFDAIFRRTDSEQKNTPSDGKTQADSTGTKAPASPVSD